MQKIVAAFLASSLLFPAGSFAQDSTGSRRRSLGQFSGIPDELGAERVVDPSVSLRVAGATSQPSNGVSWDALRSMPAGVKLRVSLADGSEVAGQLVVAKADAVVLNRNKVRKGPFTAPAGTSLREPLTFLRSDVLLVEEDKGWPFWAKALLWIGISWAVAGAIIGSILSYS